MVDIDAERERVKAALRALSGVTVVATNWITANDALPCIVLLLASEEAADHRDDTEYLTEVEWYVRVFGTKEAPHRALCARMRAAMEGLGYKRTFCWDEGAATMRQTVYRFTITM